MAVRLCMESEKKKAQSVFFFLFLLKNYKTSQNLSSFVFFFFKGKPDLNTSLPVRQTASIFKQPVTKVTNHPNNKVKTDPQKAVDQPRQVTIQLLVLFSFSNTSPIVMLKMKE